MEEMCFQMTTQICNQGSDRLDKIFFHDHFLSFHDHLSSGSLQKTSENAYFLDSCLIS